MGGKCDATKSGARMSFTGADPACQEAEKSKRREIRATVKCVKVVELSEISYLKGACCRAAAFFLLVFCPSLF